MRRNRVGGRVGLVGVRRNIWGWSVGRGELDGVEVVWRRSMCYLKSNARCGYM